MIRKLRLTSYRPVDSLRTVIVCHALQMEMLMGHVMIGAQYVYGLRWRPGRVQMLCEEILVRRRRRKQMETDLVIIISHIAIYGYTHSLVLSYRPPNPLFLIGASPVVHLPGKHGQTPPPLSLSPLLPSNTCSPRRILPPLSPLLSSSNTIISGHTTSDRLCT
jgi:hypothetical protein